MSTSLWVILMMVVSVLFQNDFHINICIYWRERDREIQWKCVFNYHDYTNGWDAYIIVSFNSCMIDFLLCFFMYRIFYFRKTQFMICSVYTRFPVDFNEWFWTVNGARWLFFSAETFHLFPNFWFFLMIDWWWCNSMVQRTIDMSIGDVWYNSKTVLKMLKWHLQNSIRWMVKIWSWSFEHVLGARCSGFTISVHCICIAIPTSIHTNRYFIILFDWNQVTPQPLFTSPNAFVQFKANARPMAATLITMLFQSRSAFATIAAGAHRRQSSIVAQW